MRAIVVVCFACVVAGCSDDPEDPNEDGASGAGAAGSTGTGAAPGEPSSTGGPQGPQCGSVRCDVSEYCGFADDLCGETNDSPKCQPFPPCQPEAVACGCDNLSYKSGCDAADQSSGIRHEGPCMAPEGKFTCTYESQPPIYCAIGTEYCSVQIVQSGDYPLQCLPVPEDCEPAPAQCCGVCAVNYCGVTEDGQQMTVYCD